MMRTAIISASELAGLIEQQLKQYIDEVKPSSILDLFDTALDQYFYGNFKFGNLTVVQQLTAFGLTNEDAVKVDEQITRDILRQIQTAFGIVYPSRVYIHQAQLDGTIVVTEYPPLVVSLPVEPLPTYDEVIEGIERGDWFPEKMRRSVGQT